MTTWATLDEGNRTHYQRKPKELVDAEYDEQSAWSRYEQAVDHYYDQHYGDERYFKTVDSMRQAAEKATALRSQLYDKYYGSKQAPDAHLEQAYEDRTIID